MEKVSNNYLYRMRKFFCRGLSQIRTDFLYNNLPSCLKNLTEKKITPAIV